MIQPETVVAYDATIWPPESVRHLARRNGKRGAFCGDPLQPAGFIRYAENQGPDDKDVAEADCHGCLFARALDLCEGLLLTPKLAELRERVNSLALDDADGRIVEMLAALLRETSWGPTVLLREHFPVVLVEAAVKEQEES